MRVRWPSVALASSLGINLWLLLVYLVELEPVLAGAISVPCTMMATVFFALLLDNDL